MKKRVRKPKKKEISFHCPACDRMMTTDLQELKTADVIPCVVCATKHEGKFLRDKLKQEIEELEKAYVDYSEKVDL
ncbi:MAG: hypothetical protein AB9895_02505 [Negativicutes bacterium]